MRNALRSSATEIDQAYKGLTGTELIQQTATTSNQKDIILTGLSRNVWADFPQIYGVANRIQVVQGVVDGQEIPVERGTIPFYLINEGESPRKWIRPVATSKRTFRKSARNSVIRPS